MFGIMKQAVNDGYFELTPGFETPDWAKGAVMYQIMVDRFNNGDKTNDVVDNEYVYIGKAVTAVKDWNENLQLMEQDSSTVEISRGVIDKLDYFRKIRY